MAAARRCGETGPTPRKCRFLAAILPFDDVLRCGDVINASQQPQIEIDISSTFVLDANNEVWELNSHELGFSVPNKKGPRKSTF